MDFTHNFSIPGLYALNLTVSDAWGNTDSVEHVFNILAPEEVQEPINGTSDPNDDSTAKAWALLLLVPVFIFIAIVYILYIRNR